MVKAPQALNASTKRYHKTQALMGGATRPASGIKEKTHTPNKGSQTMLITGAVYAIRHKLRSFIVNRSVPKCANCLHLRCLKYKVLHTFNPLVENLVNGLTS